MVPVSVRSSLQDACYLSGTRFPYLQNKGMRTVALNQRLSQNHLGSLFLTQALPSGGDLVRPGWGPGMCVFPGDLMQIAFENYWTR